MALDANAFDRTARGEDAAARAFRRLADDGRLRIGVPAGVSAELAQAPPDIAAALALAAPLPRSRPTSQGHIDRIRVRAILRGDGRPGKHDADASHLSEAAEAGCDFFLTQDGKILRKRDTLRPALPGTLRIVTLDELVRIVESGSSAPSSPARR